MQMRKDKFKLLVPEDNKKENLVPTIWAITFILFILVILLTLGD